MSRLKRYKSRDGHAENRGHLLSYGWARHLGIGHSGREIMKNLTRKQTIELVDIMVDINLTQDCVSHYVSNGYYLIGFLKKYSDVDEKVLDRFINFKTRAGLRANGDDPDQW